MIASRVAGVALSAVTVTGLLSGCGLNSQVLTLKPVAGDALTGLNIAANDVLVEKNVAILVAPVCTYNAEVYTCNGSTVGGEKIVVKAQGAEPEKFTITVGSKTVYDGPVEAVLEKAGQR